MFLIEVFIVIAINKSVKVIEIKNELPDEE